MHYVFRKGTAKRGDGLAPSTAIHHRPSTGCSLHVQAVDRGGRKNSSRRHGHRLPLHAEHHALCAARTDDEESAENPPPTPFTVVLVSAQGIARLSPPADKETRRPPAEKAHLPDAIRLTRHVFRESGCGTQHTRSELSRAKISSSQAVPPLSSSFTRPKTIFELKWNKERFEQTTGNASN